LIEVSRRALRSHALLAGATLLGWGPLAVARGQAVLLQLNPRVGDTLQMRLDQQTELTGTRRVGGTDAVTTVITTMRVFTHAIVEGSTAATTILRAVTDSIHLATTDAKSQARADQTRQMLAGTSLRLRIARDGTVALADSIPGAPHEVSDIIAVMPAAFPRTPVSVGDSWVREMPLPGGQRMTAAGGAPGGWLHTKFRLDSIGHGGELAYVSMRGEMTADPTARYGATTVPVLVSGVVSGTMLVNRRRGWLTESIFTVVAHSVVDIPGAAESAMRFQTRLTQRMRTVDKR
jgi:hypothetical protein